MRIGTGRGGPGSPMVRVGPATAVVVVVAVVALTLRVTAAGTCLPSPSPPDPSAATTISASAANAATSPTNASRRRRRWGGRRKVDMARQHASGAGRGAGVAGLSHGKTGAMRRADRLIEELRGAIGDERVLDAIRAVPREAFVPRGLRGRAYENIALPIGQGQTISQPLVVARMVELLRLQS